MRPLPEVIHYTSVPASAGVTLGFECDELGEFDQEDDLATIEGALRDLNIEPIRLGWGGALVRALVDAPPPMLWNLNSGVLGGVRTAQVANLCEMLAIPLVGSGAWTASVTQDKTATLDLVQRRLPHLPLPTGVLVGTQVPAAGDLPVGDCFVIKPNNDESSRGLQLVDPGTSRQDLLHAIERARDAWGRLRVEAYIPGHDVVANAAVGRDGTLVPLEPLLLLHNEKLYDGGCKARMSHSRLPLAELSPKAAATVRQAVTDLCRIFDFRHYARFDFRLREGSEEVIFLEANYCPSFEPRDDFAASAAALGYTYSETLAHIMAAAESDRQQGYWASSLPQRIRRNFDQCELAAYVRNH